MRSKELMQQTDCNAPVIIKRDMHRVSNGIEIIYIIICYIINIIYTYKINKTIFALSVILLVVPSCLPRGPADTATFDCSIDNPIYELIMEKYTQWLTNYYQTGVINSQQYGGFFPEYDISVWIVGASGFIVDLSENYENWNNIDKMLIIKTAVEFDFDGAWYGNYGSFGFVYSEKLDPASVFNYYTITRLTDTVYCYIIKEEYIQEGS